ncbi:MAG: hypothetical protein M3253_07485, partial [Chloroflexota bacterium]|nr:hypothetical protein [Chloroflexota bacterium]
MTHQDRFIDLLNDWLEDQPITAPDQLLESVVTDLQRTPQRGGWRAVPRRIPMFGSNAFRFAMAAAVVALAAVVGVALWTDRPAVIGPGAEMSPTQLPLTTPLPAPTPTATPPQIVPGEPTPLEAGRWSGDNSFLFRASFDVPDGW